MPHPSVYLLGIDAQKLPADRIYVMSANAWDIAEAANLGFKVNWVNRFGHTVEMLPSNPAHKIKALDELPALSGF